MRVFVIILWCGVMTNHFCSSFLYIDLQYEQMNEYINSLVGSFVKVSTAVQLFNINPAKDGTLSCSPLITRITDFSSLDTDNTRPQLVISGEIHGDERVGPSASLATAQLLALSSDCLISKNTKSCDEIRAMANVSNAQMTWLAFLATRRDTFVIPTANCLGYIKCQRNDAGVDPNRDFPYSRENNKCMMSTTARIFHHLMRRHLIQVVVTFHSGMVAIGYEWGSKNHMSPRDGSPDDLSNADIGATMVAFGGSFEKEKPYPVGRINSLVYPVDGGMEDWLYAAGWDKPGLRTDCLGLQPGFAAGGNGGNGGNGGVVTRLRTGSRSLSSDNANRRITATSANGAESSGGNRALVFLVETSDRKVIKDQTLGQSIDILDNSSPFNGHVPRNVRLSLLAVDLLQPYVCLNRVKPASNSPRRRKALDSEDSTLADKLINSNKTEIESRPHISRHMNSNQSISSDPVMTDSKSNPHHHGKTGGVHIQWYVGGGTTVDHTFLAWHTLDSSTSTSDKVDTANWTGYMKQLLTPRAEAVFDRAVNHSSPTGGKSEHKTSSTSSKQDGAFPVVTSTVQTGQSRWRAKEGQIGEFDATSGEGYAPSDPLRPKSHFNAVAHPLFADGTPFSAGRYWLVAWSVVDVRYGNKGQGEPSSSGPQSHFSNARSNPQWMHRAGDRLVVGRRYWPSDPVVVTVSVDGSYVVESAAMHCAWWGRTDLGSKVQSTSREANVVESPVSTTYPLSDQSGEYASSFVTAERHYLLALLVLGGSISCCLALMSYWRRNRIYSSLIGNKYISVNSLGSASGLEQMKLLNMFKSPARGGGVNRQ